MTKIVYHSELRSHCSSKAPVYLTPAPSEHTQQTNPGGFYWDKVQHQNKNTLGNISIFAISSRPENMPSLSTYSNLFYVPY